MPPASGSTDGFNSSTANLRRVLDGVRDDLLANPSDVSSAMATLSMALVAAKRDASWEQAIDACRRHPVRELLHQDPLTARAFASARGYQGRAEFLDIIYDRDFRAHWRIPVTPLGQAIFAHTIDSQAAAALREQRAFLAALIDETCAHAAAHVLSAGCGHMRELELSTAIKSTSFGRIVGLDHDAATLDRVRRVWGPQGVEAMTVSLITFLANPLAPPQFDLVYAAGLFDHLDSDFAPIVLQRLIDMVRPGGRLVISNFTARVEDAAYVEAFMGWRLIYRDAAALLQLAKDRRIADASVTPDTTSAIIYLDLRIR